MRIATGPKRIAETREALSDEDLAAIFSRAHRERTLGKGR